MSGAESDERGLYKVYIEERNRLIAAKQESARSYDRAILTLSAGAIALSITFLQFIEVEPGSLRLLYSSWFVFVLSMLCVLFSFLASQKATEVEIDRIDEWYRTGAPPAAKEVNPYASRTRWLNRCAAVTFPFAVLLFGLFAAQNSTGRYDKDAKAQQERWEQTSGGSRQEAGRLYPGQTGAANQQGSAKATQGEEVMAVDDRLEKGRGDGSLQKGYVTDSGELPKQPEHSPRSGSGDGNGSSSKSEAERSDDG